MPVTLQSSDPRSMDGDLIKHAAVLLSQQVWCWGCDIERPEGNWLLQIGFDRIEPPSAQKDCSSVYSLELPQGRQLVLRGFGVFYGDRQRGGVFLPRYEFQPRYTTHAKLECPPWSDTDLPTLSAPTDSERNVCASLTLNLIDWIRKYEQTIVERLGLEYRRSTLVKWDNGNRPSIPAEEMVSDWRFLRKVIAEDFQALFPRSDAIESQPQ